MQIGASQIPNTKIEYPSQVTSEPVKLQPLSAAEALKVSKSVVTNLETQESQDVYSEIADVAHKGSTSFTLQAKISQGLREALVAQGYQVRISKSQDLTYISWAPVKTRKPKTVQSLKTAKAVPAILEPKPVKAS